MVFRKKYTSLTQAVASLKITCWFSLNITGNSASLGRLLFQTNIQDLIKYPEASFKIQRYIYISLCTKTVLRFNSPKPKFLRPDGWMLASRSSAFTSFTVDKQHERYERESDCVFGCVYVCACHFWFGQRRALIKPCPLVPLVTECIITTHIHHHASLHYTQPMA